MTSFLFAALALALRAANDLRSSERDRLTRRWEPAMLEVLGGLAEPEEIFERVDDAEGVAFLAFLLGYARRLKGDEEALVGIMAAPYLHRIVPRLRRGTAESRGNAVLMLARMGMPRYANEVASALSDESPVVSMIAARSLFRPGHEDHFPRVLEHLPRFTGWSRSFLASMLAGGGTNATPLLREILADERQQPLVRAVAADALRELNDLSSVPIAVELVGEETDRELIASCLRIIKQLGHHEHIPIVRAMTASEDPVVRATAVSALGAIGGSAEADLMQNRLDDPSFWVSLEAARGLLALGDRATLERLAASDGPWSMLAEQVLTE